MEFATRQEAIETFLLQEDWASLNREIEEAKNYTNQEAEQFFEAELKLTIKELAISHDLILANMTDEAKRMLSAWNQFMLTKHMSLEDIIMAALGGKMPGADAHVADPDGKCMELCNEEQRNACTLYQEAVMNRGRILPFPGSETVH